MTLETLTQSEKILMVLQAAKGEWVSGRHFLHNMYLSQYHARIFDLERKGYKIQHSDFTDEYGFRSYRLIEEQPKLL